MADNQRLMEQVRPHSWLLSGPRCFSRTQPASCLALSMLCLCAAERPASGSGDPRVLRAAASEPGDLRYTASRGEGGEGRGAVPAGAHLPDVLSPQQRSLCRPPLPPRCRPSPLPPPPPSSPRPLPPPPALPPLRPTQLLTPVPPPSCPPPRPLTESPLRPSPLPLPTVHPPTSPPAAAPPSLPIPPSLLPQRCLWWRGTQG